MIHSEILIAIIACLGSIAGSGIGIITSNKLVSFRLEQLEKKVENLSLLIERVTALEHDLCAVGILRR